MKSFGQRPPEVETASAGRTNRVLRINNRWTKPRIERAAAAGDPSPQLSTLKWLVTVEVALGVVILGITAALVALAPPIGTHV